jgi:hypothetical protein
VAGRVATTNQGFACGCKAVAVSMVKPYTAVVRAEIALDSPRLANSWHSTRINYLFPHVDSTV